MFEADLNKLFSIQLVFAAFSKSIVNMQAFIAFNWTAETWTTASFSFCIGFRPGVLIFL